MFVCDNDRWEEPKNLHEGFLLVTCMIQSPVHNTKSCVKYIVGGLRHIHTTGVLNQMIGVLATNQIDCVGGYTAHA